MFQDKYGNKLSGRSVFFRRALLSVLILLIALISLASGMYLSKTNEIFSKAAEKETVFLGKLMGKYNSDSQGRLSQDIDFGLYWELWDTLKSKYVEKGNINEKQMFYGSLQGLASSLGDPYTIFMDPKVTKEFNDDLAGTFEGIGAEIGLRDDTLTIVAPLDEMPAQKAGIRAGDKILAINGTSTLGMSTDQAVSKIRGPKGTKVVLTIFREGFKEAKDIEIVRDVIYVKSVKAELTKDNIYVIKISNFNEDTLDLFNEAARDALLKNPKGVILDLRNNPGGFLDTAVEVASEWVKDDVVVAEKFGDGSDIKYYSRGLPRLRAYPTVVLVDGGSASASEIVAGALQDYELAQIVGTKTFGKGSVQALENLKDGSTVKITVAKWLTPKGNSINDQGIAPNVEVKYTEEDFKNNKDPQMEKAVEIIKGEPSSTALKNEDKK